MTKEKKKQEEGPSNTYMGLAMMIVSGMLQTQLGPLANIGILAGIGLTCSNTLNSLWKSLFKSEHSHQEKETVEVQFEKVLQKAGIKNADNELATVSDYIVKDKYIDIYVKLPVGVSRKTLEEKVDIMQTYYKKQVTVLPASRKDENLTRVFNPKREGFGVTKLRMYTSTLPESVKFELKPISDKIDLNNPKDRYGSLWFCFGRGMDDDMWCDLVKDNAFIAGEIGSGKSVLTHVILLQLLWNYSPRELQIEINDFKDGVEFDEYQRIPHVTHYSCQFTNLLDYLEGVEEEMRRRIKRIKSIKGCRNLADYNGAVAEEDRIPRKVILLEEMVVILGLDKKEAGEVRRKLAVICSQARAAGIHVICTTQRPSKEVIDPLIKTNINVRFGLLTVDEANSKIIIDRAGCNHLRGNGHGIYKFGSYYEEFQTMFATPKLQDQLVEDIIKKYESFVQPQVQNQMKQLLEAVEEPDLDLDDIYQRCL